MTSWQFDEFQQVGRDYGNPREVEIYDSTQADFRDVEAESKELLDLLALASSDVLIDSVRERGRLPSRRAPLCPRACGVSEAMIDYAKAKANTAGISNIVFLTLGFSLRTSR